ncbi:MAG TPA: hypothetical protein VEK76_00635 [Candidatus Binatia bacterium]|nr:hypothetical protein [Candidatus Binatia bacterium]
MNETPAMDPDQAAGSPGSAGPAPQDSVDALYATPSPGGVPAADDVYEPTVSWLDVRANCPVIASDGTTVGHVVEVAALAEEDIFHGIVFQHHARGVHMLAPASDIKKITERAVYLGVDSGAVGGYEPFHQLHVKSLGLRGMFRWKHLGWKDSPE